MNIHCLNKYYTTKGVFVNDFYNCSWGDLHRVDGPAIEYYNNCKEWYQNGLLHRLDGPAIENIFGHKQWWIEGKRYTELDFHKEIAKIK